MSDKSNNQLLTQTIQKIQISQQSENIIERVQLYFKILQLLSDKSNNQLLAQTIQKIQMLQQSDVICCLMASSDKVNESNLFF